MTIYKRIMRVLIAFTYLLLIGCEESFEAEPGNNQEAIFENLWTTFNELYAPFEERKVDWNEQYSLYRPMVSTRTTDDELFTIISQMLASLDDGHVSLTAPNKQVFFSNRVRRLQIDDQLFNLSIIKENYLENGYKTGEEDSYVYGKLKNTSIGYIFFDYIGENLLVLDDFLSKFNDMQGYIIDLRHNKGGDFTYAFSEIGRFTDEKKLVFKSKTKNGIEKNDYTDWSEWYIEPTGEYISKPVVVLTDRYTISAGERAVMAFKTFPNTTLMGDTTNGAHGTMIGRELANDWFYSLVPQKVELFDGVSYEGIGLAPDIYVKNELSDIQAGKDKTLQYAIDHLR